MAKLDDFEKLKLRMHVANALQLSDGLLAAAIEAEPERTGGQALKLELELVLRHAREFAGFNADGSFDQVPRPKKGGAK